MPEVAPVIETAYKNLDKNFIKLEKKYEILEIIHQSIGNERLQLVQEKAKVEGQLKQMQKLVT